MRLTGRATSSAAFPLFALAAATAPAHASDARDGTSAADEATANFSIAATVAPDGSLSQVEPFERTALKNPPLDPAVMQAIVEQIARIGFERAPDLGERPLRTVFSGSYRLEEDGEDYVLHVEGLSAGPGVVDFRPPRYPPSALRRRVEDSMVARVNVDAQGDVVDVILEPEPDAAIAETVREVLQDDWRFEPERIDGEPVPGVVPVAFSFTLQGFDEPPPDIEVEQRARIMVPEAAYEALHIQIAGKRIMTTRRIN